MVLKSDFSYWNNRPKMTESCSIWDWGKYLVRGTGSLSRDDVISSLRFWFWSPLLSEDSNGCLALPVLSSMRHIFSGAQGILSERSHCIILHYTGKKGAHWDQEWLKLSMKITCILENKNYFFRFCIYTQSFSVWLQSNSLPALPRFSFSLKDRWNNF